MLKIVVFILIPTLMYVNLGHPVTSVKPRISSTNQALSVSPKLYIHLNPINWSIRGILNVEKLRALDQKETQSMLT
jgi:hypothetical protein